MRWIAALVVPMLAVAAPGAPPADAVLPFDLIDNRVVLDVRIDGKGPFRCILDTGASAVVSTDVAAALGLAVAPDEESGGVGERKVRTGRATLRTVSLGDTILHEVATSVMPFDDFPPVFGTRRIDAVIGDPVFERFVVTTDYVRRTVTLAAPGAFRYRGAGTVIPFDRRHGIPIARGTLDGVPGRFGLDTGARSALLLYTPFVEAHRLREKYGARVEGVTGWGIGGPVRSQLARAAALTLGPVTVRDLVIRLSTQTRGLTTGTHLDGLVGPDVFRQFRVIFDYSRRRLVLEPNADFGRRDTWDRLGAWFAQESDHFVVIDVIEGSPAATAGLRVDDRILAVDGAPASALILPDVRTSMRTRPPGTSVRLRVRSGDTTREVVAVLRDLV